MLVTFASLFGLCFSSYSKYFTHEEYYLTVYMHAEIGRGLDI